MQEFVLFLSGVLSLIALIVFFVMAANIGKLVRIQMAILNQLKELNDPTFQKSKKFDAGFSPTRFRTGSN
jgi:hypothetical protein